jgi:hypothetical protein
MDVLSPGFLPARHNIFALSSHLHVDFSSNIFLRVFVLCCNMACIILILLSLLGSVGIATGCRQDGPKWQDIILCFTESRLALWPLQPPIQWVTGPLSRGVERPGCEAYHSLPTSVKIKTGGAKRPRTQRKIYVFTFYPRGTR